MPLTLQLAPPLKKATDAPGSNVVLEKPQVRFFADVRFEAYLTLTLTLTFREGGEVEGQVQLIDDGLG